MKISLHLLPMVLLCAVVAYLPASARAGTLSVTNGSFTNLSGLSVTGGGWYGGTPAGWTTGSSSNPYSVLNSGGTYYANVSTLGAAWPPFEQSVGTVDVTSDIRLTFTLTTLAGGSSAAYAAIYYGPSVVYNSFSGDGSTYTLSVKGVDAGTSVRASFWNNFNAPGLTGVSILDTATTYLWNGGVSGIWTNGGGGWTDQFDNTATTYNNAKPVVAQFTNVSAGTNVTVGGNVVVGNVQVGGANYDFSGGTITMTNTTWSVGAGQTASVGSTLAGTTGLTKADSGNLTLSASNSYSGGTTLSLGTLALGNANALGSGNLTVNGGTLELGDNNLTAANLGGTGGTIALGANTLTASMTSGAQYSGAITGSGGLVKTGASFLTLNGSNSYTGGTTISDGTLFVTGAGTLGNASGAITISNTTSTATLDLRNAQTRTGTITMIGQGARLASGDVNNPGSVINNGNALEMGGGQITVSVSGTGGLNVTGGGSINSSNSYTGATTISGTTGWYGTDQLFVNNANALGAASGDLTISGGSVNLQSNTITRSGNVTISGGTLTTGTLEKTGGVFALQGGNGSVGVVLAGTAGLTKSGAGTNYLYSSNTYTGATTISGGTLVTDGEGQLTAGTTLAISNGATWQMTGAFSTNGGTRTIGGLTGDGTVQTTTSGFTHNLAVDKASGTDIFSGVIAGSGALIKQGAGTLVLGGVNTYTGGTTISAGTLQVGLGGTSTTGSLGGGNIVNNGNLYLSVSNTLTITNQISGTGTLDSASLTTVLSGSNSYSGLTTVSAGILRVDSGNALGSTNAGTVVANGAQLRLQGVTVGNEALTISGNGGSSAGALRAGTGSNAYEGKVTLAADSKFFAGSGTSLTLDVASGDALDLASFTLTVEGGGSHNVNDAIVGTGGITKIGSGTMTLAASNSYSGATDIQVGRLTLSGNGRLGSGAITISNANTGTLELAVTGTYVMGNNISGAGALFSGSGETRFTGLVTTTGWLTVSSSTVRIGNGGASGSFSGNTVLSNSAAQLVFDRSDAYTYIGTISGSGDVTKSGAGTTTLTGSNSFSGALAVNSGVLDLNASTGAAAAAVSTISVATNAILLVSKSDQVNNSAAVTLSGGTIQRASGVSEVFGDLNITAASFLDFGSGTAGNLQFQSYTNTGSALVAVQNFFQGNSLQFASATFNSGNLAQFSFGNGYTTSIQGDYFTITAIPEPSTLMAAAGLLGLMLLPACCRQWRRVRFSRTVLAPSLNKSLLLSAATRSPQ